MRHDSRRTPPAPLLWLAIALAATLLLLPACGSRKARLTALAAAATPANRAATAAALVQEWNKGMPHDEPLSLALDRLEAGEDLSAFGGAVLDFLDQIDGKLQQGGEYEIFWFRVGRLAFWSAQAACAAGRVDEGATLVFAGPERWQTEGYWIKYTDHDALASMILARTGQLGEAIRRLRDRGTLQGEAEEVFNLLTRGGG